MSTIRNPIGPQPPKVYWRRRLMVLLGALAVVIVIVLIVVRPGAGNEAPVTGDDTATSETTGDGTSAEDVAAEEASDDTTDDGMCRTQNLTIEAIVDKESYQPGELPQIGMRLTNIGAVPCILDVTPTKQVYEVSSGADSYWLSSDCQAESEDVLVTLAPNEPQSTTPIAWDRTGSLPCDSSTQQVPGGDATYSLQVRLGELESAKKAFRLF